MKRWLLLLLVLVLTTVFSFSFVNADVCPSTYECSPLVSGDLNCPSIFDAESVSQRAAEPLWECKPSGLYRYKEGSGSSIWTNYLAYSTYCSTDTDSCSCTGGKSICRMDNSARSPVCVVPQPDEDYYLSGSCSWTQCTGETQYVDSNNRCSVCPYGTHVANPDHTGCILDCRGGLVYDFETDSCVEPEAEVCKSSNGILTNKLVAKADLSRDIRASYKENTGAFCPATDRVNPPSLKQTHSYWLAKDSSNDPNSQFYDSWMSLVEGELQAARMSMDMLSTDDDPQFTDSLDPECKQNILNQFENEWLSYYCGVLAMDTVLGKVQNGVFVPGYCKRKALDNSTCPNLVELNIKQRWNILKIDNTNLIRATANTMTELKTKGANSLADGDPIKLVLQNGTILEPNVFFPKIYRTQELSQAINEFIANPLDSSFYDEECNCINKNQNNILAKRIFDDELWPQLYCNDILGLGVSADKKSCVVIAQDDFDFKPKKEILEQICKDWSIEPETTPSGGFFSSIAEFSGDILTGAFHVVGHLDHEVVSALDRQVLNRLKIYRADAKKRYDAASRAGKVEITKELIAKAKEVKSKLSTQSQILFENILNDLDKIDLITRQKEAKPWSGKKGIDYQNMFAENPETSVDQAKQNFESNNQQTLSEDAFDKFEDKFNDFQDTSNPQRKNQNYIQSLESEYKYKYEQNILDSLSDAKYFNPGKSNELLEIRNQLRNHYELNPIEGKTAEEATSQRLQQWIGESSEFMMNDRLPSFVQYNYISEHQAKVMVRHLNDMSANSLSSKGVSYTNSDITAGMRSSLEKIKATSNINPTLKNYVDNYLVACATCDLPASIADGSAEARKIDQKAKLKYELDRLTEKYSSSTNDNFKNAILEKMKNAYDELVALSGDGSKIDSPLTTSDSLKVKGVLAKNSGKMSAEASEAFAKKLGGHSGGLALAGLGSTLDALPVIILYKNGLLKDSELMSKTTIAVAEGAAIGFGAEYLLTGLAGAMSIPPGWIVGGALLLASPLLYDSFKEMYDDYNKGAQSTKANLLKKASLGNLRSNDLALLCANIKNEN